MARAEFHEVMDVDKDKLLAVITAYDKYPNFVEGCQTAKIESREPGKATVTYRVSMIKEVEYTLNHKENLEAGKVEWTLAKSSSFKKNNGSWELKTVSKGKTAVKYTLEIDFTFSVPGLILNKLVKGSLPSMVKNFVKQAQTSV